MATLVLLILLLAAMTLTPLIGCLLAVLIEVLLPKQSLTPRSRGLLGVGLASGCILALWLAAIQSPSGSLDVAEIVFARGWTALIFVYWSLSATVVACVSGAVLAGISHSGTGSPTSELPRIPRRGGATLLWTRARQ